MADLIGRLAAQSRGAAPILRLRPDAVFGEATSPVDDAIAGPPMSARQATGTRPQPWAKSADGQLPDLDRTANRPRQPADQMPADRTPVDLDPSQRLGTLRDDRARSSSLADIIAALDPGSPGEHVTRRSPSAAGGPAAIRIEPIGSSRRGFGQPSGLVSNQQSGTDPDSLSVTVSIGQLIVRAAAGATVPAPTIPPALVPVNAHDAERLSLAEYLRGRRGVAG